MKENKKYLDAPKAPEELIENTLNRIHEKANKAYSWNYVFRGGIAVACMFVLVLISSTWSYPELHISPARSGIEIEEMEEIYVEEYEAYLGVEISENLKGYKVEKVQCNILQEQGEVIGDEATYYIDVNGKTAVLTTSKKWNVVPSALQNGKVIHLDGENIYIAKTEGAKRLVAGFQVEGVSYYLIGEDMSLGTLKKFIKNILGK